MDRRRKYRDAAEKQGTPGEIVEWALRLARPRIELRPEGHSDGPVVGRYGGRPSLPAEVAWAGYPDFLASVDCAALPPDALDIPLPADGHLLFFANRHDPSWDVDRADKDGRVVYVPAGTATAERSAPEGANESEGEADHAGEPFALRGHVDWNMPGDGSFDAVCGDEERERLFEEHELGYLDDSTAGELTLGGYACPVQDDPCHGRWPDGDDEAWLLLAQATYGFTGIPHQGVAFWLIRREDLAERNFAKVKFVVQTYL
jgi:uncharacterized protein YwqG